ncbi:uncharacterized protein LOC141849031 [Brevipalpus obovatus]|uniref:uncharacterized protein LOC141849031 n=1 Tax=Brevipalpus obovatus TaxID=246614 RepID=UPI003D9EF871
MDCPDFSLHYENDCPILSKIVSTGRGNNHMIFKCKMCQFKSYTKINIIHHYRSHVLPQFPHKCPVCSLGFERIDFMLTHFDTHREPPTPWSLVEVKLYELSSPVPSASFSSIPVPQQPLKRCKVNDETENKGLPRMLAPLKPRKRLRKQDIKMIAEENAKCEENMKRMMYMYLPTIFMSAIPFLPASFLPALSVFSDLTRNQLSNNRK